MDEHEQVDESAPTPEPVKETRLRRSTKRRMVGGVAGGIAERFDIDANIVRVVFVVLTVLYGLGAAIYLAMWVLIPQSGSGADDFEESGVEPPTSNLRLLRYVVLAAIVVIAVIAISTLGGAPRVGNGFAVLWLAFLFVLAVLSLRSSARQHMLRRFIALVFVSFVTVIILLSGAVLGFLASTGVPMTGGSGARTIQPTSLGQVQRTYRTEFGALTVDLRQVHFTSTPTSVTASVAVGLLTVDVPANAIVYLKTHIGLGPVDDNGPVEYNGQFYQEEPWTSVPSSLKTLASQQAAPHLILNAQVGVGRIDVQRGTPGQSR
ncbi:MAG: PspC domain-containing protein [Acidimicrobiales bacterium]|jgi:phage shock protein PspC (stress-responsive transcriptional regulator)